MQYTPRRLRLEKEKKSRTYRWHGLRMVIFFLAFLGIWFVLKQVHGLVVMTMTKTICVEQGTLERVVLVEAVLVRNEQVYSCTLAGQPKPLAAEGERVPEGALIAIITGEGSSSTEERPDESIYARKAGIVSYKLDGLEHVLTPETITQLKAESIYEQAKAATSQVVANQQVIPSGTGFVKIVNNLKPMLLDFSFSQEDFNNLPQVGKVLKFRLDNQKKLYSIKVGEIIQIPAGCRVIAEIWDWPQQFLTERLVELELIVDSYEGIIIPEAALSKKEGVKGVYKMGSNSYQFVPIEIIGQVDDYLAVLGLDAGDEILIKSPNLK